MKIKTEYIVSEELDILSVKIHLPKVYGKKPIEIPYRGTGMTVKLYEINLLKFLHSEFQKYVNHREQAFIHSCTYNSKRRHAIDRINFRLSLCQEGRLSKIFLAITNLQNSLAQIQPDPRSRHYSNYIDKIKPLIDWCVRSAEESTGEHLKRPAL